MENKSNVYFAMSYYQIVYAILHSQYTNKKSRLYVVVDYLKMDDELYEKLNNSSFFTEVVFYSEMDLRNYLFDFLEKEKDFDKAGQELTRKIDDYYKDIINIYENEDVFVFNMRQLYYGYIVKHVDKIILLEDGYKSFNQQLNIHQFNGRYNLLEKFCGNYFPSVSFYSDKIKKIIINDFSDINKNDFIIDIEECNYVKMIDGLNKETLDKLLKVFSMDKELFKDEEKIILLLTQPLSRFHYCTLVEQYLLYRKMIRELSVDNSKIIIKPHPADTNIYEALTNENVEIIDIPYPADLLLFKNKNIKKVVSFGSTANDIIENKAECIKIFDRENFKRSDVNDYISDYIDNEKLNILMSGKCLTNKSLIEKVNIDKLRFNFEIYNTNSITETQKYALSNNFDYFCYDDSGVNYHLDFFNKLALFCTDKIKEIYSFSCIYQYNGREYTQESKVYNNFLKFSYFDKLLRSNIEVKEDVIETMQSLLLNTQFRSYLIRTKIKVDYNKSKALFIDDYKIKTLKQQYLNENRSKEDLQKLFQNLNLNKICNDLACLDSEKENDFINYINELSHEEISDLLYQNSLTFLKGQVNKIDSGKYQSIDKEKENSNNRNSIKKIIKKYILGGK